MDSTMMKMTIFMFVITVIFNWGLQMTEEANASLTEGTNVTMFANDTITNDPDPAWGFLGPLLLVWDVLKKIALWFDAMPQFLQAINTPEPFYSLLAWPWRIAWVYNLISFIRGWRA